MEADRRVDLKPQVARLSLDMPKILALEGFIEIAVSSLYPSFAVLDQHQPVINLFPKTVLNGVNL